MSFCELDKYSTNNPGNINIDKKKTDKMNKLVHNKLKLTLSRTVEYLKGLPKVPAPLKILSQGGVGDGPRTKFRFIGFNNILCHFNFM